MVRSPCARTDSYGRFQHRLSFESLEVRRLLSTTGTSPEPNFVLPLASGETVITVAETPVPQKASVVAPTTVLSSLRTARSYSVLRPATTSTLSSTAALTGATTMTKTTTTSTNTCSSGTITLCKVPLDYHVNPVYACPGLSSVYCVPQPTTTTKPTTTQPTSGGSYAPFGGAFIP